MLKRTFVDMSVPIPVGFPALGGGGNPNLSQAEICLQHDRFYRTDCVCRENADMRVLPWSVDRLYDQAAVATLNDMLT